MHFPIYALAYIAGVMSFLVLAGYLVRKHLRAVKKATVVCPTAQLPAEVRFHSDGHIESCSRLPSSEDCSQTCAPQLQFSADELSEFAAKYEGQNCTCCGTALTRDDWYKSRLAIPTPVSKTRAQPICFTCYQTNGAT